MAAAARMRRSAIADGAALRWEERAALLEDAPRPVAVPAPAPGRPPGPSEPRLLVVIGSTRPQAVGRPVGRWLTERSRAHGAFDVEVADLARLGLPFLDEPHHTRLQRYTKPHTKAWSATVERSDAFVFVTPEYNHAFPAPLKNAIDFLFQEWAGKPVGFVSYGGMAAGTRAVEMLKTVVTAVRMVPVADGVSIPFVTDCLDAAGHLVPNDIIESAAATMLDELARLHVALRHTRAA